MTKVSLSKSALMAALNAASRVVEKRNTIPILGNIRLAPNPHGLELTATDLDLEYRAQIPGEISANSGAAITVHAGRLHDITRNLPDGAALALSWDSDAGPVTLTSGRSRFVLQSLAADDFPNMAADDFSHTFSLPGQVLAELVEKLRFAISNDETRYYLNGIYLHTMDVAGRMVLRAVATDGHRLARMEVDCPAGASGMPGIIVPKKTIDQILRLAQEAKTEPVTVSLSTTKIRLVSGGEMLTSKLIDGTFPDYGRAIPVNNNRRAVADRAALAGAAARVAAIQSDRGKAVKLTLASGILTLSSVNSDAGEAREEIDVDYDDDELSIGFNSRYLADIIATLGGDTVLIRLGDSGTPAIFQSHEGAPLLTLCMPMRV